ncbi:sugar ABC transporter substrate-binding protein [Faecalicatena contorta]|uniref:Monosaccharide ABC transporter substrate-binding protein, CUT2 family n=1 Tax=Faecalicatena contorta TaxID=39482 RepID=A0A315ZT88_9FIRM|nr:sugar ABC transporter substrate-binding protein [Faecalicatena contorta]PWJ48776.1 monosaccharide ABC transporter substrate-binding protein (CUT2 family) [Faecalicatena contorta]SUQ15199.1 monosaccharide ABC transporter substrate-binding protein, CUT2 family [Faecalicatena contorta]
MKKRRLTAAVLAGTMVVGLLTACTDSSKVSSTSTESTSDSSKTESTDTGAGIADFKIDASQIPQEKLDTTLYVACSIRGLENPYIATIADGMDMFCEYLDSIGQKYEKQVLDSGGSNDVEIDNMKQFAAKAGGNAIAYADPNESAIAPSLAEAMAESGGYLGTAWNKPDDVGPQDYDPNWVIHTSADNVANGKATAEALFDSMGGKGKIFVIEGMLGNTASNSRVEGLEKALEEYPDIEVAHQDTGNWATNEALTLVETWLNDTPDVGGIWCANDNMATGALQALDAKGLKGKVGVTGIDANPDIVEGVKDGSVIATVSSNGYLQGGYTLAVCYAVWTGLITTEELPENYRTFLTPAIMITKDTVDDYVTEYVDSIPEYDFSDIWYCKADK